MWEPAYLYGNQMLFKFSSICLRNLVLKHVLEIQILVVLQCCLNNFINFKWKEVQHFIVFFICYRFTIDNDYDYDYCHGEENSKIKS